METASEDVRCERYWFVFHPDSGSIGTDDVETSGVLVGGEVGSGVGLSFWLGCGFGVHAVVIMAVATRQAAMVTVMARAVLLVSMEAPLHGGFLSC